jgi:FtsH-binding integral membrane protein
MHKEAHMYDAMTITQTQAEEEQRRFIAKVYSWMGFALVVTGLVAMYTASNPNLLKVILGNQMVFFGLIIGELVLVVTLAAAVKKMSVMTATLAFIGYAALNGLTLSVIFVAFTAESLASTFFVTAGTFGVMSAYGFFTKKDLTSWGNLLFMALVGLIIASLVNMFFRSSALYWVTTYAGILIFVGLTAYDTQKIKRMNVLGNEGTDEDKKEAIIGALTLYLDFINLFLMLLRIFGRRK